MGYNILIVDDSSIVRQVLIKTLKLSGVEVKQVFEANHGQEALDILETTWIDLVFLDINMPVMNGIEFMRKLRSSASYLNTPVIVVSTEGNRERKAELADLEIKAYLRKPTTPELLAETIQNVLGGGENGAV
jgi:two-component system, chemotaxis family, chemotaxis protein CheY